MLESNLWKWLKKPKGLSENLDMNRIENMAGAGMPDVEGIFKNQFWIELKVCARPKHPTTPIKIKFQPLQTPWLKKRWALGGSAWCLVQVGEGHKAGRYLIPGNKIEAFEIGRTEQYFKEQAVNEPDAKQLDILLLASHKRYE